MTLVVDTSSLVAVVLGEADADRHLAVHSAHADDVHLSAASAVELGIVVEAKQGVEATEDLHHLIALLEITTVPRPTRPAPAGA